MNEPVVALDMAHENHDMPATCSRHARRRRRAREFPDPVRGQIEFRPDFSEYIERRLAAAEGTRATLRPASNNRATIGIDKGVCLSPCSPCLTRLIRTASHVAGNRLALLFVPRRCIRAHHERNRKCNRKKRPNQYRFFFQTRTPSIKNGQAV